jgi:hypothetical protein
MKSRHLTVIVFSSKSSAIFLKDNKKIVFPEVKFVTIETILWKRHKRLGHPLDYGRWFGFNTGLPAVFTVVVLGSVRTDMQFRWRGKHKANIILMRVFVPANRFNCLLMLTGSNLGNVCRWMENYNWTIRAADGSWILWRHILQKCAFSL